MARSIWSITIGAILLVSGLSALHVWRHYEDQLAAGGKLANAATAISQARIGASLRGVDLMLQDMARGLLAGEFMGREEAAVRLKARVAALPDVRNLFIVGADGITMFGTMARMPGIDVRDREYFQQAAVSSGDQPVISEPLRSRVYPEISVFLARPVRDATDALRGVVVAAVNPEFFEKEVRSTFTDAGNRAAIVRRDGTVLTRLPDPEKWLGKSLAGTDVFEQFRIRPSGQFIGRSFADGSSRLISYAEVPGYDVFVSFSLSQREVLSSWRRSVMVVGGANLAFVASILFLATLLSRRRQDEARALARIAAAEADAKRQAERFDRVLQASNDGWWDWDVVNDRMFYSPRWWSMLGYAADDLPPGTRICHSIVHPDDVEVLDTLFGQALANGPDSCELEFRLRHKDGHYVPVLARTHVVRDAAGRPLRVSGANLDLTERKRAEAQLRASEETFRSLYELSPYGMARNRMDGTFCDANHAFLDIVGYDKQALLTLSYWDLTPKSYIEQESIQLREIDARNAYGPYEKEYIHRSGRLVPVRLRGVRIIGSDGVPYIWSIVEDITERRAADRAMRETSAELARSNADLEQFAYVASHDLREPLRMVSAYVSLLERRFGEVLGQDGREFVAFARDGAQRMDRLICDLLDYSRVKRMGDEIIAVDAGEAVTAALQNLQTAIQRTGAEVSVAPLPRVLAAPVQLQRLFQNLIGNALKYGDTTRPPRIRIAAETTDGVVRFSVADNGIGIDPQYHERVFGIFQRLHTRQEYDGTGIGLAICRSILERHGGRIWVESTPGEGSTFLFTLTAAG